MIKKIILLLFLPYWVLALGIPEFELAEDLNEKKRGQEFLRLLWDTGAVIEDIEAQTYLKKLGDELRIYSVNPNKHFDFLLLDDDNVNAFAGPYGYIGVHTGLLLLTDSESELAGVLSHEISHITQNHLNRFSHKASKQGYLMWAGILAATLVKDAEVSEAIVASTVAGTAQKTINFTREHEWEADRIGTNMLLKSNFDPKGMAYFFEKLKDSANAEEFLRSHPLSINRVAESLQRGARTVGKYRKDSFEYLTIAGKLYYHKYQRNKVQKNQALKLYMQAYQAFEQQKYKIADKYIKQLSALNNSKPSVILAGRIAAKLGDIKGAKYYLSAQDEPSVYYLAKAYAQNKQRHSAITVLKSFLRQNGGTTRSHQLLSMLYVKQGALDRAHIENAKELILKAKFNAALGQYKRAKSITNNKDLFDLIGAKINQLQQTIELSAPQ